MKRIITAVSFAVLAAPVFAADVSAPFEQNEFDRNLPNVQERAAGDASVGATLNSDVWAHDYNFIAPAQ